MSNHDVQPETSPLNSAPVRLDLNAADFQIGRAIFPAAPQSYSTEAQLPQVNFMGAETSQYNAHALDHNGHHVGHYHHKTEPHHHHHQLEQHHHQTEPHHQASHQYVHHRPAHPSEARSLSEEQIAAIRNSWQNKVGDSPYAQRPEQIARPADTRIAPSREYGEQPPAPSRPGNNAWTSRVLDETVSSLEGKSPQVLERALDPRLGCARCVTQFGHRAYGLPITDSVANLESSMQARNFTRVPMNAETIAQMAPGDIIVGHRNATLHGAPLHGHTAVYMGDGKIFNNNAFTKTMITESLDTFQQPLHDRNGRMHMNGYSDVWIYRPRASNG